MARVAAVLPGYATVARASDVLHLAPRSVRDLIYAGRMPSLRIGRLHYVNARDLEVERRRRLGLRLPPRAARAPRQQHLRPTHHERPPVDPELRRQRAAERAADVRRWAARHESAQPRVPFRVSAADEPGQCAICGKTLRSGARVLHSTSDDARLCLTCGRRALHDWADTRRLEAAAARRMAEDLSVNTPQDSAARIA